MTDNTSHPGFLNPRGVSLEYRVVIGLLVWLGLLSLGSGIVSLPFFTEPSAAANINYAHTMYLHGLLIGMVGLIGLVALDVFGAHHKGLRTLMLWGTLGAALFSGVGGIFDRSVTDTLPLWIQIVSFFFLDEILITLSVGLYWRARETGALTAWVATASAVSALLAAVMGHLAGWLLEFGAWPPIILSYTHFAGLTPAVLQADLIGSHSHEMVVAVIGLLATTSIAAFTAGHEDSLNGWVRLGLWDMAAGIVLMTIVYVVAGFTQAQPPTLFAHGPQGLNGIAGDDLITGLGVMLGAAIALVGVSLARLEDALLRWASAAFSLMMLATVVVAGYYIELSENIFQARGATSDAVFTFWHQDFAFFIIPAVMVVLQILHRMVDDRVARARIGTLLVSGGGLAFLGGLGYVFLTPARDSVAFWLTAIGFAALVSALGWTVATLFGAGEHAALAPPAPVGGPVTPERARIGA